MEYAICNCIVCAKEFEPNELHNVTLSKINVTRFKICEACLNSSDPAENYKQAKQLVDLYIQQNNALQLFVESKELLNKIIKL
jgi:hypothetical protein